MKKTYSILSLLTLFLILVDQASKYLASLYLRTSQNNGVAFGVDIPYQILIFLILTVLVLLAYFAHKELNLKKTLTQILLSLILAGGISNLIDRIALGSVTDFIKLPYWPTFNIADIYISVGVLLTIFLYGKIKKVK